MPGLVSATRSLNDDRTAPIDKQMPIFGRPGTQASRLQAVPAPDRWRQSLEAALRVSEIAASDAPLQEAVQSTVDIAVHLLSAERGSIMLFDDASRSLVVVAARGLPPAVGSGFRLAVGESIAGRVLATGSPLLLHDVDRDDFVNFVPKSGQIMSSVVVPLRAHGRTVGVLNLAISNAAQRFTEDDLRVAQMFADQAAGLIQRTRLHEQAEHRSTALMALVEASKGLLGAADLDTYLQETLEGVLALTGAERGFSCLFDIESGEIARGVFRGLDKGAIRAVVDRPEVQTAADRSEVMTATPIPGTTIVAVGLGSPRETRGVIVASVEETVSVERLEALAAFGRQCNIALAATKLHSDLEKLKSQLESTINGVPNPIVLADAKRRVLALNPAAEELFDVSSVFSVGRDVDAVFDHEVIQRLLTSNGKLQDEAMLGSPPRTYRARANDVVVPGAPVGRVLIMDDLTAEREIVQTHRDFVAMIGHELRTPLTIIKGFARTLLRRAQKGVLVGEDAVDSLSTIDLRAAQLERLIEDLLYVSRIETREAKMRLEPVDIRALVEAVVEDLLQEHQDREIDIDIPDELVWHCDETKVALVVRHLVENALKYSDDSKPVRLRAADQGDQMVLQVIDRGVGIVSHDLPHIFERFRQIDGSSTRTHGGTGVGLYLCAQLIRMHEGQISVDSTWGKGSTFSLSLPQKQPVDEVTHLEPPSDEQRLSSA